MSRKVCVTSVDGHTGFAITELLLSDPFSKKVDSVVGLALNPATPKAKEAEALGAQIVHLVPGDEKATAQTLKDTGCDTLCLIPPAHRHKKNIATELINAAKKAGVPNVLLNSSAGCDYADPQKQPRLREFIGLESLVMASKGDSSTNTGHSACVIRAGFYAENLFNYAPQAQSDGALPLPIGEAHKFAPVALGDIAHIAVVVLTGKGPHGFDDKHRGQIMVVTGPKLYAGEELATAACEALDTQIEFQNITEAEARDLLKAQSESDESEIEYLLEYYSLVREGKTNYIATTAFVDVTGTHPTQLVELFKMYAAEVGFANKAKKPL